MSGQGRFKKRYIPLVIILMLVTAYWLFANTIIKRVLETQLSESYGAEVNIDSVDHALLPLNVTIRGIALTNATRPSRNQVVIGTAKGDLEWLPLLSKRVIINQLSLLDVKFDEPRETPGHVYRQPQKRLSFDEIKQQAKDAVPTVDELLARSPLKTTAAVENAKEAYDNYKNTLESQYAELPDKSRIEDYKHRVDALKSTDYSQPQALLEAQQNLEALKTAIREDREKIAQFTTTASSAKTDLSKQLSALKNAPRQDYELLKGVVAGDDAALEQVTQMVFGDKAAQYTEYLMSAVQIVLPLIQGDKKETTPSKDMPSVWIRRADVTVAWKDEKIGSIWHNITNTHPLVGEPTTFTISAAGKLLKQFESSGQFWIDDAGVDASQTWSLAGLNLSNVPMLNSDKLRAALESALLSTSGQYKMEKSQLSGGGKIDLSDLAIEAAGTNKTTSAIANVLNALSSLALDIDLTGSLQDPGLSVHSRLDKQFAKIALDTLTASQQDKLDTLRKKLNSMTRGIEKNTENQRDNVEVMLQAAQGDSAALENLLKTQLDGLLEKQKGKLFDKLKSKLGQ